MTLIQLLLCDHCQQQIVGPSAPYRVEDGPVLDICASCQKKPFRQVKPSARAATIANVMKLALRGTSP